MEKIMENDTQTGCYRGTWGFPEIKGTFWGDPCSKDSSILGSILGSPYVGKLPHRISVIISVIIFGSETLDANCGP